MAEELSNKVRFERLEYVVRRLAERTPPEALDENMLLGIREVIDPPEEKKPLLKWKTMPQGWYATSKQHDLIAPFCYRVFGYRDRRFSIARSDAELLGGFDVVLFDLEEEAKAYCERLEAADSSPKKPEEKKPPEPTAFSLWLATTPFGRSVDNVRSWNAALNAAAEQYKHGGDRPWPSCVVDTILALKEPNDA